MKTLDEYDRRAREVCPVSGYAHDVAGDDCCEGIADVLRAAVADALFEANAVFLLHDVSPAHPAVIEVRNRAWALRQKAAA